MTSKSPGPAGVRVETAGSERAGVVWRLLQLYLYEMSDLFGGEIGEDGEFGYPFFPLYWEEPARTPLLIRVEGRLAGFALVRETVTGAGEMAEFFVLRNRRRAGVGRLAARRVLDRRPGPWEISFHDGNVAAAALWRGLAAEGSEVREDTAERRHTLRFVW